jgi:hypothetical protein
VGVAGTPVRVEAGSGSEMAVGSGAGAVGGGGEKLHAVASKINNTINGKVFFMDSSPRLLFLFA